MTQSDPVSWFMIEPGWKVVDAQGNEAGRVEEVVGDTGADIFSGLSISVGLLRGHRYVPAELVGTITEGQLQLKVGRGELDSLEEYLQPPPKNVS